MMKSGECLSVMLAFVRVIWLEDENRSAFHRAVAIGLHQAARVVVETIFAWDLDGVVGGQDNPIYCLQ
jgi:hypothetical protein